MSPLDKKRIKGALEGPTHEASEVTFLGMQESQAQIQLTPGARVTRLKETLRRSSIAPEFLAALNTPPTEEEIGRARGREQEVLRGKN